MIYGQDASFFISNPSGQISSNAGKIRHAVDDLGFDAIIMILRNIVGFMILSGVLFVIDRKIMLITIGYSTAVILWEFLNMKKINKLREEISKKDSFISGIRSDGLTNAVNIKTSGSYENEYRFISKYEDEIVGLEIKRNFKQRCRWVPRIITDLIVENTVLIMLILMFDDGAIKVSDVMLTVASFNSITRFFRSVGMQFPGWQDTWFKARQAWTDLFPAPLVVDRPGARNLRVRKGAVEFSGVSFKYKDDLVLRDFNLRIHGGEHVGIVGLSGAGKTTLSNLLLRLWDVNDGAIKIDGQDIRDVRQNSVRKNISYVPQDPVLFNRSFLENIKYGNARAKKSDVAGAAKLAHIDGFISGTADGYGTIVGNRGIKLSGGQRQRVALARAILQRAKILIMDEPTSALDSDTESKIQANMDAVMRGRTTIIIAHRLSTLKNMDRIYVMDKGRIAEQGTHAQLIRRPGIYKKMWGLQTRGK
jgi:ATP-binding cassette subfamily B protein